MERSWAPAGGTMAGWMLVDRHKHRIAKAPNGTWGMYCPMRGPDDLIYTDGWYWVLVALQIGGPCPHDVLLNAALHRT